MKILVTGGAGFIGSNIVDAMIERGHQVVVLDNLSTGRRENVNPKARLVEADITGDYIEELMLAENFDVVNHHAAHMELRASIDKPVYDANTNVLGTVRILDAARKSNVGHIVLASTTAIFGEQQYFPATESHPIIPLSAYGASKASAENYAEYYRTAHNMSIACLRYTTVYGERQNPNGESGVVAIFLQKFMRKEQATIHGSGEQTRDYLYVADVVDANNLAHEHRLNGNYIVASGTEVSVNQIVDQLRTWMPNSVSTINGPPKIGDAQRTNCSAQKLTEATGWHAKVSIQEGLKKTTDWFVRNKS